MCQCGDSIEAVGIREWGCECGDENVGVGCKACPLYCSIPHSGYRTLRLTLPLIHPSCLC